MDNNTFDINQEILINNEIKKETEFLISLLNIKQSAMNNQMFMNNNMNLSNPMMNPNFNNNPLQQQYLQQQQMLEQLMHQQQLMYQQLIQQQQMNNMKKEKEQYITVIFRDGRMGEQNPIMIPCSIHDKVSDIIEKYKNMAKNSTETQKFIYNAQALNPNLTLAEAKLVNNANIFVVETEGVRGG